MTIKLESIKPKFNSGFKNRHVNHVMYAPQIPKQYKKKQGLYTGAKTEIGCWVGHSCTGCFGKETSTHPTCNHTMDTLLTCTLVQFYLIQLTLN